ncbi:MAG: PTS sugar transporter subunit IIC, partial [Clostridia bacterium]|nr:PTS sugar transporter subunit IIC [Clostridia bacterium]
MKTKSGILTFTGRIEQITAVRAVRNGLTNIIPVLLIGAFALILQTFPVDGYQTAIKTFANGFFLQLFEIVYSATFGVLSVYMTFSISYAYMRIKADPDIVSAGAIVASLISFFILIGTYLTEFGTESTGPKSMFLAIITGLGASWLYYMICKALKNRRRTLFSAGADKHFNRMLTTLLPISVVAVTFALLNAVVIRIFNVESFRELLANAFNALFSHGETGFLKGFFMVLLSSVLWFFGIRGSDTLEGVMQTYFTPGIAANQAAIAAGEAPTTILTKEFFDCFVLMGGCGATICLLLAILIFSRNRARRGLGIAAAFPMIFNINE